MPESSPDTVELARFMLDSDRGVARVWELLGLDSFLLLAVLADPRAVAATCSNCCEEYRRGGNLGALLRNQGRCLSCGETLEIIAGHLEAWRLLDRARRRPEPFEEEVPPGPPLAVA